MYLVRDTQTVTMLSGLFGFAYQGWIPLAFSALLAIPNADSAQLAGATALFDGTGHILTFLIPWSVGVLVPSIQCGFAAVTPFGGYSIDVFMQENN